MTTPPQPTPGWYPDPATGGQRWWDGVAWATQASQSAPPAAPGYPPAVTLGPQEKSSGIAVLLTILWPGAGHLYLGLTKRGMPFVVANAIGFVLTLATVFLLFPVYIIIWLVTLVMTVGKITDETNMVNDAIRRGIRIDG